MKPPTPFMLEVLRRIHQDAARSATPGWVTRTRYPENQIKGLVTRGLVQTRIDEEIVPWSKTVYKTLMVSVTDAGRALLSPPVDVERLPDWVELDDLPVLDEETASWPLDPRYYDVGPAAPELRKEAT